MTGPVTVRLGGRELSVEVGREAAAVLAGRASPLVAEMELYFSCLIRKQVRFPAVPHPDALCAPVADGLIVCFRPVMTRACAMRDAPGKPELEAFPIARRAAFIPRWLRLELAGDRWSGEFGY